MAYGVWKTSLLYIRKVSEIMYQLAKSTHEMSSVSISRVLNKLCVEMLQIMIRKNLSRHSKVTDLDHFQSSSLKSAYLLCCEPLARTILT